MKEKFTVTFEVVPDSDFSIVCPQGGKPHGCFRWMTQDMGTAFIKASYYDTKHIASHECEHAIYGPDH